MQFINSSYTTYFNVKYQRIGHLFQGRYKAFVIDKDSYAAELSRYIHLNPVRAHITSKPEEYKWNSYQYFISSINKPEFLSVDFILSYFGKYKDQARIAFKKFIEEGLAKSLSNPLNKIEAGILLGEEQFFNIIKDKYLDQNKKARDLPSLRTLRSNYILPENILNITKGDNSISEKEREKITVYLLRKYSGYTLDEIAEKFFKQKSAGSVSQMYLRFKRKRQDDREIDKKLKCIERKLSDVEV